MNTYRILTVLLVGALVVGCVSKGDHQAVLAQLEECRNDKTAAQSAAAACEDRFEREIARFDNLDATLGDVLPATLREFEDERAKILEQVPVQVQGEVANYMDEFSDAVRRSFHGLQQDNLEMMAQLSQAQEKLESLGVSSEDLGRRVDTIGSGLAEQNALRGEAAEIAERLREFDRTMVNCRNCDDRLRLNRKERETISNFHAELVASLLVLATGEEPEAGEEGTTPEVLSDEEMSEGASEGA